MPEFKGTIQLGEGDGDGLATNLTVDAGRLVVTAQEHEIGNWAVEELSVKRQNSEFRIRVEGEELVVAVADPVGLSQVLDIKEPTPKRWRVRKPKAAKSSRKGSSQPKADPEPATIAAAIPPPAESPAVDSAPQSESLIVAPVPPAESLPAYVTKEVQSTVEATSPWARLSSRTKLAGLGVIVLVMLFVIAPNLLALLMMLAGMGTLFLAIAAKSDSGTTILPPPFFATDMAIFGGIGMVLLAVVIIAIT
ncbi:MAG: hypothetical protein OEM81_11860 [Acidimicrobiia bacterium]|nr:hypothetical protein [Acidimicrobiia bacterium]MDH3398507.1 hypothetical protein [Acidimicrobiia bacterium]